MRHLLGLPIDLWFYELVACAARKAPIVSKYGGGRAGGAGGAADDAEEAHHEL